MNCRVFNILSVDSNNNTITKRSEYSDDLVYEIAWYNNLPEPLKYLTPNVVNYSTELDDVFIELEYIDNPTLRDLYISDKIYSGIWVDIILSVNSIILDMGTPLISLEESEVMEDNLKVMYENKTIQRIEEYISLPEFKWASSDNITINGVSVFSLQDVISKLEKCITTSGIYRECSKNYIHGDLWLGNILYDVITKSIKLIDPRGSFGSYLVHGDSRYDIAKFNLGFLSDTAMIIDEQCDVLIDNYDVTLNVLLTENQRNIKKHYHDMLVDGNSNDRYTQIRLIESILLLSMPPMHSESLVTQHALICKGLELFSNVYIELFGEME